MNIRHILFILLLTGLSSSILAKPSDSKTVAFIHSINHLEQKTTDIIFKSSSLEISKQKRALDKELKAEYKSAKSEYLKLKKAGVKDATKEQRAKALGKDDGEQDQPAPGQPVVRSITARFGGSRGNLSAEDFGESDKKFAIKPSLPKVVISKSFKIKAEDEDALLEVLDNVYVDEMPEVDKKFKKIAEAYQKFLKKVAQ